MRLSCLLAALALVVLAVGQLAVRPLSAQDARAALTQGHQAYDVAEFERAVPLLARGLDPTAGVGGDLWIAGVHKLVESLIETGREPLADAWIRWAHRVVPDIPVDSINFPPNVVSAFLDARHNLQAEVSDTQHVFMAWEWPTDASPNQPGAIRIEPGDVTVNGRVEGGDFLVAGVARTLPPGSSTVSAAAAGYLPARVAVEVLPGVTTALHFRLEPVLAGEVSIDARPWAEVFIDGDRVGYTLLAKHRVAQGTHRITLVRPGYAQFDTTVTVMNEQHLRLGTITLRERPRQ
ncbi:MAG: PEGA domain-containing protein [Gemmatimonadales bacterium]